MFFPKGSKCKMDVTQAMDITSEKKTVVSQEQSAGNRILSESEESNTRSNPARKKYIMDLKKWEILNLLEPEFISEIRMVLICGRAAIIVTYDRMVYGIGINDGGRLGIPQVETTLQPKKIEVLCGKNIKTLAYGRGSCVLALTEEGEVYSWGSSEKYRLGHGSNQPEIIYEPTLLTALQNIHIVDITCNNDYSFALSHDGKVYMWGLHIQDNYIYSLKNPTLVQIESQKAISISCGWSFYVIISENNKLCTWGKMSYQSKCNMEDGDAYSIWPYMHFVDPIPVDELSNEVIVKVVCGGAHVIALTKSGTLYVWGENYHGQLGIGNKINQESPVMLSKTKMGKVLDIAATYYRDMSIAINNSGIIYIWGYYAGQDILTPTATQFSSIYDVFIYTNLGTTHKAFVIDDSAIDSNTKWDILEKLESAFNDCHTSDLTIQVENQSIYVHKSILRIRSEYFKNMFQHDWMESKQNIIKHDEFSYVVYKAYLKYLYTGEIYLLDGEQLLELLDLSTMYCEVKLQKNCVELLKRAINLENVIRFYVTAIKLNVKDLEKMCYLFALENMTAVINTHHFAEMEDRLRLDFIMKAAKDNIFKT